jgi:hypothetical protein
MSPRPPKREDRDPAKNPLVSFYETIDEVATAFLEHARERDVIDPLPPVRHATDDER